MELMIRISALAVIASIFALLLKKETPYIAIMITVAACCAVFALAADIIEQVISLTSELTTLSGMTPAAAAVMVKSAGIAIIAKFSSDLCRDAGQNSASSAVEFAAAVTIVYISIPLIKTMLEMISGIW